MAVPEQPVLEEYWPDIEGLALRETVTDEAMPEGTFFDLATVHVLTTATLDRLRELYPGGRFEARRFRPNIVVQTTAGDVSFVERDWVDRTLTIGDEVRLKVTATVSPRPLHSRGSRIAIRCCGRGPSFARVTRDDSN
jgi:hypothetical protein